MIPNKDIRIKPSNVLVGPHNEYRIGDKASLVGWLKELFLYGADDLEYCQTSNQDRKDYANAVNVVRKASSLSRHEDLHDFEEKGNSKESGLTAKQNDKGNE